MDLGCCHIVDVDLRKFFDTINHGHLRELLKRRVRDGVIVRLIGKWLNAGVMEEGIRTNPETGRTTRRCPQPPDFQCVLALCARPVVRSGGKTAPEGGSVLDSLCGRLRHRGGPRRRRTADHGGFTQADEQVRLDGSPGEDAAHPVPTGGIAQLRFEGGRLFLAETFDFLGFTHYWGQSRAGEWVIKRKTARSRLKRAFQALAEWCRKNRHQPLPEQHQTLKQKLQGHYGYRKSGATHTPSCGWTGGHRGEKRWGHQARGSSTFPSRQNARLQCTSFPAISVR